MILITWGSREVSGNIWSFTPFFLFQEREARHYSHQACLFFLSKPEWSPFLCYISAESRVEFMLLSLVTPQYRVTVTHQQKLWVSHWQLKIEVFCCAGTRKSSGCSPDTHEQWIGWSFQMHTQFMLAICVSRPGCTCTQHDSSGLQFQI